MESELSRVVDVLPGLAWTALPTGEADFVNGRWCDYTGLSPKEASGWGWQAATHPEDQPELVERWNSILASGKPGEMEARLRRFDGEYRWFLIAGSPMRDEAGRIVKWYGLNTDIEDRKRAREALRKRELTLQSLVDGISVPIIITTFSGDVEGLNRATLQYFGELDELQSWKGSEFVHPDDMQQIIAAHEASETYNVESRYRRADGTYHWFNVLGLPLRDTEGHILRWFRLLIDIDDRKRAEEIMLSPDHDLSSIINTIPMTAWSTRADGYCDFVNQRWLDYAGLEADQVRGWGWGTAIHPDDLNGLRENWLSCLASGTPVRTEARMRRFDGVYRWFLFLGNPLRDEAGNIVKWFGTNVDIEDRKRAEEALQASERNLSQIINTIPTTAWSTRPDGYCDFLSDRWLDYAGFSLEQARGWNWAAAIHPDDADGLRDYWLSCLASGTPVDTEARIRRFDGVYRWFLFRANPLRDDAGNIVKWYGTNVDIEDRKRAEVELRRSEAFLAKGQRLSATGSFSWRVDTDDFVFSEELYRIFAFERDVPVTLEQIRGRVLPEDIPLLSKKIDQARAGSNDLDYEIRLRMPDNSIKYLRTVAYGSEDPSGRLEIIGATQDVTERRLSDETLGKVRSELARVARAMSLGALTASIAHEINQPLAGIITNTGTCVRLLAADPPNIGDAREIARRIVRDVNRASDVIKRLRALFAKKSSTSESIDLNEAVREVIALTSSDLQANRVVLRAELSTDVPPVDGDRVQLQQVVLNLLLNASDAVNGIEDRPRQIVIQTQRDEGNRVRLTVQDTGVGIAPQDADKLFEAFYTTKNGGMGIGLSVSRSIIESLHGRIWASSNEGPGATFSFSIPCTAEGTAGLDTAS